MILCFGVIFDTTALHIPLVEAFFNRTSLFTYLFLSILVSRNPPLSPSFLHGERDRGKESDGLACPSMIFESIRVFKAKHFKI